MVNLHWTDKALLQRDHERALKFVQDQGIIICFDPAEREFAKRTFAPITNVFLPDLLCSALSLVYVYDMDKQPPAVKKCDGYSSVSERQSDGQRVASVGISLQALHAGEDYAVLVFLHELTHILSGFPSEHGTGFHAFLDRLIERYNRATGAAVQNDYFGLAETAQKGR